MNGVYLTRAKVVAKSRSAIVSTVLALALLPHSGALAGGNPHGSPGHARADKVIGGLNHPWSVAFLPDGDLLITERSGTLRRVHDGRLLDQPVAGLPAVQPNGQGGLLDVMLHPEFPAKPWVYLSYSAPAAQGQVTAIGRGRWRDGALHDWQELFRLAKATDRGHHFGSRMAFDGSGHLYFSIGDRGERQRSQDLGDAAGSILRLRDDGSVPKDNPFIDRQGALAAIYSSGHRNPQGLIVHPISGAVWSHEHGPQGGDEINVIRPGANYGWPLATHGREYGTGFRIGQESLPGMVEPAHYWAPSIAPSGMALYSADRFPQWRHNLFVGSLKYATLIRLVVDEHARVLHQERLLEGELGRIRDVRQGPDGYLYVLTDARDAALYRISP